jgi:hypothetical protein
MNKVLEFFKGIGHLMGRAMGVIKENVPEELLEKGLAYVLQAEGKAIENALKRDWVLVQLEQLPGVNENTARLVIELAVAEIKRRAAEATAKAVASASSRG